MSEAAVDPVVDPNAVPANQADPAPDPNPAPAPSDPADPAPADPAGDPAPDKGNAKIAARFSEITAQKRAAEERAQRAEQRAAELEAQTRAHPAPAASDVTFDPFDQNQVGEVIKQAVQSTLQAEREAQARAAAAQSQASKAQTLASKLFESGLEGAVLIASGADIPFTQAMIDSLSVSEKAAEVADHLGRNPTEARRIAALPPSTQGYELAKLEGRLASQPRTTAAAPPPPAVGSRAAPLQGQRDDMPIADWMRLDQERAAARRR